MLDPNTSVSRASDGGRIGVGRDDPTRVGDDRRDEQERSTPDEIGDRDQRSVEAVRPAPAPGEHDVQPEHRRRDRARSTPARASARRDGAGQERGPDEREPERDERRRPDTLAEERDGEQRREDGVERCDEAGDGRSADRDGDVDADDEQDPAEQRRGSTGGSRRGRVMSRRRCRGRTPASARPTTMSEGQRAREPGHRQRREGPERDRGGRIGGAVDDGGADRRGDPETLVGATGTSVGGEDAGDRGGGWHRLRVARGAPDRRLEPVPPAGSADLEDHRDGGAQVLGARLDGVADIGLAAAPWPP